MLNTGGALAVMDHHVTINWDDGPTLHRIAAQVRYHTAESAMLRTLRINASHRYSDEPLSFMALEDALRVAWIWQARQPGWTAQLAVTNQGEDDVFLDALEVIRLDYAAGGLFNLGAPPGLWRVRVEEDLRPALPGAEASSPSGPSTSPPRWESWSPAMSGGFVRQRCFIVQPTVSNRTHPPALMIRALDLDAPPGSGRVEIQLEATGERFERFTARYRTEGWLLGAGASLASPQFWVVAGDDAEELCRLT
jgi:hypothetical protein